MAQTYEVDPDVIGCWPSGGHDLRVMAQGVYETGISRKLDHWQAVTGFASYFGTCERGCQLI